MQPGESLDFDGSAGYRYLDSTDGILSKVPLEQEEAVTPGPSQGAVTVASTSGP